MRGRNDAIFGDAAGRIIQPRRTRQWAESRATAIQDRPRLIDRRTQGWLAAIAGASTGVVHWQAIGLMAAVDRLGWEAIRRRGAHTVNDVRNQAGNAGRESEAQYNRGATAEH